MLFPLSKTPARFWKGRDLPAPLPEQIKAATVPGRISNPGKSTMTMLSASLF
jgi:hypothetical protein